MLTPDRLLRLFIEMIFILLGGMVVWLGLTGHIFFDRRRGTWIGVSLALVVWGGRALFPSGKWAAPLERWTRGLSLTVLGLLMFAISRVPFYGLAGFLRQPALFWQCGVFLARRLSSARCNRACEISTNLNPALYSRPR